MHHNPYLNLFQSFKFNINQHTSRQQAIQISRQLGFIHNATGIIIADLIKCLGLKYKLQGQLNSSTPSTEIKDTQNEISIEIEKQKEKTFTEEEKTNKTNQINLNECNQIILDEVYEQKKSQSFSNKEPFQLFECKNISKKLQKQFKKIDKQKINTAIQKAKGSKFQQIIQLQSDSFSNFKQNKQTIVNRQQILPQKNKQNNFQNKLEEDMQIKQIERKNQPNIQMNQSFKNSFSQNNPFDYLNQFAFTNLKKVQKNSPYHTNTQNQSQKILTKNKQNDKQAQSNSMIGQVFQGDQQYQKIGEDFNFVYSNKELKKNEIIEKSSLIRNQSSANIHDFLKNNEKQKENKKSSPLIIQIFSDEQKYQK